MSEQTPKEYAVEWVNSARITYKGRGKNRKRVELPPISPLGENVAYLLHRVYGGIYNAHFSHERVAWHSPHYIRVCVYGYMSSFDSDRLTRLLFYCHDLCIRLEISGANQRYIALGFSPRKRAEELPPNAWITACGHPTLEEAVAKHRERNPNE